MNKIEYMKPLSKKNVLAVKIGPFITVSKKVPLAYESKLEDAKCSNTMFIDAKKRRESRAGRYMELR